MIQRSMSMNNLVLAGDKLEVAVDMFSDELDQAIALAEQTVRYLAYVGLDEGASSVASVSVSA